MLLKSSENQTTKIKGICLPQFLYHYSSFLFLLKFIICFFKGLDGIPSSPTFFFLVKVNNGWTGQPPALLLCTQWLDGTTSSPITFFQ